METLGASEMWKDFGFAGASGCSPWHRMDGSVALLLSCPAAPVACAVTGIEHFTHALENLQQSFTQRPVFPGLFSYSKYVFWAHWCGHCSPGLLRGCSWWQYDGEGTAADRAPVSGAAFQSPGHVCSFLLCPVQIGSDALQGVLEEYVF